MNEWNGLRKKDPNAGGPQRSAPIFLTVDPRISLLFRKIFTIFFHRPLLHYSTYIETRIDVCNKGKVQE